MLWIIVGLIILIYVIVRIWLDNWNDLSEKIAMSLFYILGGGLLIILLAGAFSVLIGFFIPEQQKERILHSKTDIYSLVDNRNIEGHFALGSGTIDTELNYYYIVKNKFGEKIEHISSQNTYLNYTDKSPSLERYRYDYKNKLLYLFAIDTNYEDILNVPKNTTKYDYKVDLN